MEGPENMCTKTRKHALDRARWGARIFSVSRGGGVFRVCYVFLWLGLSIFSASPICTLLLLKLLQQCFLLEEVCLFS
jgi:hypothetical protein